MRTPTGRPYTDPGVAAELKRLKQEIDVLNRRTQRQPKIPKLAGGGPIGATRAEATIVGRPGLTETTGWAFSGIDRPGTTPPALTLDSHGHCHPVTAGWYSTKAHIGIGDLAPGTLVNIYVNPATTPAMGDVAQHSITLPATSSGTLSVDISTQACWYYGYGQDPSMDGVGLLGIDAEWSSGVPSWVEAWLIVTRLG